MIIEVVALLAGLSGQFLDPPPPRSTRFSPAVILRPAPEIQMPGTVDSNNPAFWAPDEEGVPMLHVLNSWWHPVISRGDAIDTLSEAEPVSFDNPDMHGRIWMEAVVVDDHGVLYGYYHNEPGGMCSDYFKTAPRIGAARSFDNGLNWEDLGIILEAPLEELSCDSPNRYFAGGVGDFSVVLNQSRSELYFFFSAYPADREHQGVSVGRMPWILRDSPRGNVSVWSGGEWTLPEFTDPENTGRDEMVLPRSSPLFETRISWFDPSGEVDSFWGPSVHWNTALQSYVMLLNRASDMEWTQEGVYVSFGRDLSDPVCWTPPMKILSGGGWYPQVLGLEPETGTDKVAGAVSRLFVSGTSHYLIEFDGR
jgi:hypothetical protein